MEKKNKGKLILNVEKYFYDWFNYLRRINLRVEISQKNSTQFEIKGRNYQK
jgi:hypothetical protein